METDGVGDPEHAIICETFWLYWSYIGKMEDQIEATTFLGYVYIHIDKQPRHTGTSLEVSLMGSVVERSLSLTVLGMSSTVPWSGMLLVHHFRQCWRG